MKKLFIKILLLLIPIFIVLSVYAKFGEWFYNLTEFPMWASKSDYINSAKNKVGIKIILGDSKAVSAFIPDTIGENYYNLALGGGSPMEGYYQLKKLIENNNKIDEIIISYSPYHFEFHESFLERTLKYSFLNSKELDEIISISERLNNKFWDYGNKTYTDEIDKTTTRLEFQSIYYKLFYNYLPEFKQSIVKPRIFTNLEVYKNISERKGNFDFGAEFSNNKLNLEAKRNKDFEINKVLALYFQMTLDLAKQNGIKIYYFNTPFNEASFKYINKKYIEDYNKFIAEFADKDSNFIIGNVLGYYPADRFGDPSHLNHRGQKEFSVFVKNFLSEN